MPLYDFKCEKCGHVFEARVMHEQKPPRCPKCESSSERLPPAPSFRVRGGTPKFHH